MMEEIKMDNNKMREDLQAILDRFRCNDDTCMGMSLAMSAIHRYLLIGTQLRMSSFDVVVLSAALSSVAEIIKALVPDDLKELQETLCKTATSNVQTISIPVVKKNEA